MRYALENRLYGWWFCIGKFAGCVCRAYQAVFAWTLSWYVHFTEALLVLDYTYGYLFCLGFFMSTGAVCACVHAYNICLLCYCGSHLAGASITVKVARLFRFECRFRL